MDKCIVQKVSKGEEIENLCVKCLPTYDLLHELYTNITQVNASVCLEVDDKVSDSAGDFVQQN